jgi:hypothetical protein
VAHVIYQGDHAAVVVPVTADTSVEATWGEPVEVPDALAENLLTSSAWIMPGASGEKKAKKATTTLVAPDDNNEKGAN